jgi:hypothetical protein
MPLPNIKDLAATCWLVPAGWIRSHLMLSAILLLPLAGSVGLAVRVRKKRTGRVVTASHGALGAKRPRGARGNVQGREMASLSPTERPHLASGPLPPTPKAARSKPEGAGRLRSSTAPWRGWKRRSGGIGATALVLHPYRARTSLEVTETSPREAAGESSGTPGSLARSR